MQSAERVAHSVRVYPAFRHHCSPPLTEGEGGSCRDRSWLAPRVKEAGEYEDSGVKEVAPHGLQE